MFLFKFGNAGEIRLDRSFLRSDWNLIKEKYQLVLWFQFLRILRRVKSWWGPNVIDSRVAKEWNLRSTIYKFISNNYD